MFREGQVTFEEQAAASIKLLVGKKESDARM